MALKIESFVGAKTARLVLSGELDGSSAPAFREAVAQVLSEHPHQLVLGVEELEFMSSAGLRVLIFAKQKQPSVKIYILRPRTVIVDTLRATGFYDAVYVTDTEPAGV